MKRRAASQPKQSQSKHHDAKHNVSAHERGTEQDRRSPCDGSVPTSCLDVFKASRRSRRRRTDDRHCAAAARAARPRRVLTASSTMQRKATFLWRGRRLSTLHMPTPQSADAHMARRHFVANMTKDANEPTKGDARTSLTLRIESHHVAKSALETTVLKVSRLRSKPNMCASGTHIRRRAQECRCGDLRRCRTPMRAALCAGRVNSALSFGVVQTLCTQRCGSRALGKSTPASWANCRTTSRSAGNARDMA